MDIQRCSNPGCARLFQINQLGGQMPGTKEPEDIICPYCSHTIQQMCNGVWQTYKLSDVQEQEYNRDHSVK